MDFDRVVVDMHNRQTVDEILDLLEVRDRGLLYRELKRMDLISLLELRDSIARTIKIKGM